MRTAIVLATLLLSTVAAAQGITVNGRKLSARDRQILTALEQSTGQPTRPGNYWYDTATGAVGSWGGPTLMFIQPGLGLGGPLPANASGGGNGMLTGVYINGRELHPVDVQQLTAMLRTPVMPGRWWVDAQGNAGMEGGPMMFNLMALAQQNGGGSSFYKNHGKGKSTYVGKGCAAVHGSTGSGESKVDHSYYVGCE